jgi:hypothetical protein
MSTSGDRERLKRSFISILTDHPIVTLLGAMLIGALEHFPTAWGHQVRENASLTKLTERGP